MGLTGAVNTLYYMNEDRLVTKIIHKCAIPDKDSIILFENFSDDPIELAFGVNKKVNYNGFATFLESRCFPRARANCREVLHGIGVDFYAPELIIRKTHGMLSCDHMWIKFEGEELNYRDVRNSLGLT